MLPWALCLLASCATQPGKKSPAAPPVKVQALQLDALQTALSGHRRAVLVARFAPGGKQILTTSEDGTARIWSTDGKPGAVLKGHGGAVTCGAFSPNGKRLLTGSDDRTARLWSIFGESLAVLRGHTKSVTSVAFSPDGETLLTASMDNTARLWKLNGAALAVLRGHDDFVQSALFSPDGATVITASMDGTARLWRLPGLASSDGKLPKKYRPKADAVRRARGEGQPANSPLELATGVPECDEYLVKYLACVSSSGQFPPSTRQMVERSLLQAAHTWRQSASSPSGRKSLAAACKTALAAAKRSMVAWGCAW